mgnify:CR=1 FL=1|tara:strand:- start:443 stop:997 length:555 start_codon:yes stop_codon:yes gene_type:complete
MLAPDDQKYFSECVDIIDAQQIDIDEEKILDLLQIVMRWPEDSLETINHCGMVSNDYFTNSKYLDYSKWKKLYDLGFTSQLYNVLDLTSQLRELNESLYKVKGSYTSANFYLSKGSTTRRPSFNPHHHDYHVIIKPIYGKCKWLIGKDTQDIEPGQIIVLPAFTDHAVTEALEPRLSLTLNVSS